LEQSVVPNSGRIGATGLTPLDKQRNKKIVGMQLYKDVDSDHQQRFLHSNIYIPDQDEEVTNNSDNRQFSSLNQSNVPY
jgi:hypothetical protein